MQPLAQRRLAPDAPAREAQKRFDAFAQMNEVFGVSRRGDGTHRLIMQRCALRWLRFARWLHFTRYLRFARCAGVA